LDIESIEAALPGLVEQRGHSPGRASAAARAILTTDTRTKEVLVEAEGFVVGGMAKGAAMLSPNMATMLAVLTTDASSSHGDLQAALGRAVRGSFNEMTVDGCTSTNDTVIVMASGHGSKASEAALTEALKAACDDLAVQMVADAEGGTKVVRVHVVGAVDDDSARRAVRRVAESQLVKSSWYGEDPNWGRVVSELGSAGTPFDPDRVSVAYGAVTVCRGGVAVDHDEKALRGILGSAFRHHLRPRSRNGIGLDHQRRSHARVCRAQHGTIVSRLDLPAAVKAAVLCDALPHIRRFAGRTVVIKYGGNALAGQSDGLVADESAAVTALDSDGAGARGKGSDPLEQFAEDVVLLRSIGILPVVVHGGGPQIGSLMARLGKVPEFRGGLRVTDSETLEIARMVLVGKVNRDIVGMINVHGPLAVGLSGEDAGMITAAARDPELGYVGDVVAVDPTIVHRLLAEGLVPVIATIGSDRSGQAYNINADTVAGAIAETLEAEKLVFLTDVEGIRSDAADATTLIHELVADELDEMVASGAVAEGMVPKAMACVHAVRHGVASAHVLDGRVTHAVLLELLTSEGVGTMVIGR